MLENVGGPDGRRPFQHPIVKASGLVSFHPHHHLLFPPPHLGRARYLFSRDSPPFFRNSFLLFLCFSSTLILKKLYVTQHSLSKTRIIVIMSLPYYKPKYLPAFSLVLTSIEEDGAPVEIFALKDPRKALRRQVHINLSRSRAMPISQSPDDDPLMRTVDTRSRFSGSVAYDAEYLVCSLVCESMPSVKQIM
jgi:hypothetical protein